MTQVRLVNINRLNITSSDCWTSNVPYRTFHVECVPEPPPPYSPRHESWGLPSNANTTLLGSSSLTSSNWFPFTDQKETSSNEILSSLNLAAGSSSPALPSTPSRVPHHPSSQVHHFHHNLHHHTHTHNVQVQNHYFGAPPPGLESFGPTRTSSTSSSQIYDAIPNPSWNYTGLSNINAVRWNSKKRSSDSAEKKQKQELAKKMSNQLPIESIATRIVVKGQPHSAPVVSRMPFSYRDVAARSDHTSSSNHPNHQPDELQRKELSSADLKLNDSKAVRTKNNDHRETGKTRNTIDPTDFNKKNRVDNEFQKINNRKNKKEKAVTEVAAPVIFEGVHPVDSSSRYDVLKNLESPNQSYHEKKSANGRPPLIQKIFSRSSSPADDIIDTEEEDPHRVRSSSTHVHQNGNGQVKKDQRKRVAQVNQRRRKGRKEEPSWLQNAFSTFVDVLFFVWGYACFGLQWTLLLIVEVCQKIADIFVTFGKSLWAGTCKGLRNVILAFVYLCFFVVFAIKSVVVRLLTFINMIGAEESDETVEEQDWGCKKEIPIATNATEFADRLSRETIRDAYSVFGLRSDCSDDDIKRNYKRLAALVSPDKCTIDAADQVYELVDVAFSAIGYKDSRSEYTLENLKNNEVHEQLISVWNDMTKAVEEARNTIFCDCENTHFRVATSISPSQARSCKRCGVKHPAKQNDIWVEKRHLGLTSTYYTCTDNVVYDITSWATCKKNKKAELISNDGCRWTKEHQINKRRYPTK
nr:hypothetical protein C04A2.7 - Caenorhabditis elegans [Caenorhabditis elegans]